jgi:hypothetical protein
LGTLAAPDQVKGSVGTKAERIMALSKRYLDQRAALELETQAELLKDKARKLRDLRYVGDTVQIGDKLGSHGSSRGVRTGTVIAIDGDIHTVDMGKGELLTLPRCDIDNWY